jgi:hypothetical protein
MSESRTWVNVLGMLVLTILVLLAIAGLSWLTVGRNSIPTDPLDPECSRNSQHYC